MPTWLPWALLVFAATILAAMPWRRPHPNHEFMLQLLRLLEDDDSDAANLSSRIELPAKIDTADPLRSSDTHT
jgi:hypothetical protein